MEIKEYIKKTIEPESDGSYTIKGFGGLDEFCSDQEWVDALTNILVTKAEEFSEKTTSGGEVHKETLQEMEELIAMLKRYVPHPYDED